jgi:predicted GIY-YIG superfamily endonuclease
MPEYNKSKIYKLQCEDGHFYIGSTCNELRYRFAEHKSASKTDQRLLYKYINQVGWNTVRILLLEEVVCENKQQLLQIEDKHIRQHKENSLLLNERCAVRTKEDVQACCKAYKESHTEELSAYNKVYDEAHKEERSAYREAHKEQRKVYDKARYEAQKKI